MDGIHDLGGRDGFGSVEVTDEEPFAADYEGVAHSMTMALMGQGVANVDEFRHAVERLEPGTYLGSPYYERWLHAIEALLVENSVIQADAVQQRVHSEPSEGDGNPDADAVETLIEDGGDWRRQSQPPAFDLEARVRVRNQHPEGHSRCPGYLKRARGTIEAQHGTFVLPDANADGTERAEPMYSVAFDAAELWGEAAEPNETIYADLWESYLREPPERPD